MLPMISMAINILGGIGQYNCTTENGRNAKEIKSFLFADAARMCLENPKTLDDKMKLNKEPSKRLDMKT